MRPGWRRRRPEPAECPSWCTTTHDEAAEHGLREHVRRVAVVDLPDGYATVLASVTVVVVEDLAEGRRGEPVLSVSISDCLDADEARRLALALLDGIDFLGEVAS